MIGDILQPTHLLFILVIALLVLGPKRLPEVGRSLGRGLRDFKDALSMEDREHHHEVPTETGGDGHEPHAQAPTPAASGAHEPHIEVATPASSATHELHAEAPIPASTEDHESHAEVLTPTGVHTPAARDKPAERLD